MFYNFYLLIKYNVYINIKICVNIKIYKYIFKYIYKNSDRINFRIKRENNINQNDIKLNLINKI